MRSSSRRIFLEASATVLGTVGAPTRLNATQITIPTSRAKALMSLFNSNIRYLKRTRPRRSSLLRYLMTARWALSRSPDAAQIKRVFSFRTCGPRPRDILRLVNYILREEPALLKVALNAGAPIVQLSWGHASEGSGLRDS
jgi:hypothetical protein